MDTPELQILPEHLKLISEIDEFKGKWHVLSNLTPDRLALLKRVATIESVGSSTRIEGARLTDSEVEKLLSGLSTTSFQSRDDNPIHIIADDRERKSDVIQSLMDMEDVTVSINRLSIGDYCADNRLVFERKTLKDFALSIIDGRLFILQGLPGVGRERAIRLLENFGSIQGVINASIDELQSVDGIGKNIADRIRWAVSEQTEHYGLNDDFPV